jgi:hypothetical protein
MREVIDVPGDFAECGVFYGHGVLAMLHETRYSRIHRHIWAFDSFSGHPPQAAADTSTLQAEALEDYWRVTQDDVWRTLELGTDDPPAVLREQVTLVPGWFSETMPGFKATLAYVHLDPDYYQSTKDALAHLWPRVHVGGVVLFGRLENPSLPGKGIAIREFLSEAPSHSVSLERDARSSHHFLRKLG